MKVIYIAGPFRGADGWAVKCNVHQAEEAARMVARLGAMPLCPHSLGASFSGTETDQFWLDGTLELMRRCDAIFMVDGWEASEGAKGEREEARRLGIRVVYTERDLLLWLQSDKINAAT